VEAEFRNRIQLSEVKSRVQKLNCLEVELEFSQIQSSQNEFKVQMLEFRGGTRVLKLNPEFRN